jgi:pimeloyl-ACP methyl ester carboxylesterase
LLDDNRAVIRHEGEEKLTPVRNDWGGAISRHSTMNYQQQVERLVIMNLTHPKGYADVIANPTPYQKANVQYARGFASSEPKEIRSRADFWHENLRARTLWSGRNIEKLFRDHTGTA